MHFAEMKFAFIVLTNCVLVYNWGVITNTILSTVWVWSIPSSPYSWIGGIGFYFVPIPTRYEEKLLLKLTDVYMDQRSQLTDVVYMDQRSQLSKLTDVVFGVVVYMDRMEPMPKNLLCFAWIHNKDMLSTAIVAWVFRVPNQYIPILFILQKYWRYLLLRDLIDAICNFLKNFSKKLKTGRQEDDQEEDDGQENGDANDDSQEDDGQEDGDANDDSQEDDAETVCPYPKTYTFQRDPALCFQETCPSFSFTVHHHDRPAIQPNHINSHRTDTGTG
jgi:hypothetical protein